MWRVYDIFSIECFATNSLYGHDVHQRQLKGCHRYFFARMTAAGAHRFVLWCAASFLFQHPRRNFQARRRRWLSRMKTWQWQGPDTERRPPLFWRFGSWCCSYDRCFVSWDHVSFRLRIISVTKHNVETASETKAKMTTSLLRRRVTKNTLRVHLIFASKYNVLEKAYKSPCLLSPALFHIGYTLRDSGYTLYADTDIPSISSTPILVTRIPYFMYASKKVTSAHTTEVSAGIWPAAHVAWRYDSSRRRNVPNVTTLIKCE